MSEPKNELQLEYQLYILMLRFPCSDDYYPPYSNVVGVYKSREIAIQKAKKYNIDEQEAYKKNKYCVGNSKRIFYVKGYNFNDFVDDSNIENNMNVFISTTKIETKDI